MPKQIKVRMTLIEEALGTMTTDNEICPSCGKQLQCTYGNKYIKCYCPRCKYTRYDGSEENPWKIFRKSSKRR